MSSQVEIEQLSINTIRTLAMDAVQAANSGHPGTPMALAPLVYNTLWQQFLRFDPADPIWPNRDRFVLSIGHASMLLYALLHLTGVKAANPKYEVLGEPAVTLDDIRRFRQLDSKCPGHPEYRWTSGVEMTTGPLGQGVATSVGMAIAQRWMAAHFNRLGFTLFDYDVYALCGDGDMMEGVSSEAASLAGHLKLSNLCWIYDSNRITIEGATDLAFSLPRVEQPAALANMRKQPTVDQYPPLAWREVCVQFELQLLLHDPHRDLVALLGQRRPNVGHFPGVVRARQRVVSLVGECQRNQALRDQVAPVDAREALGDHRRDAEILWCQCCMFAGRPLAVIVPADDEPALPSTRSHRELRINAAEHKVGHHHDIRAKRHYFRAIRREVTGRDVIPDDDQYPACEHLGQRCLRRRRLNVWPTRNHHRGSLFSWRWSENLAIVARSVTSRVATPSP
jgi:transketolase N-terminal domain/subunit